MEGQCQEGHETATVTTSQENHLIVPASGRLASGLPYDALCPADSNGCCCLIALCTYRLNSAFSAALPIPLLSKETEAQRAKLTWLPSIINFNSLGPEPAHVTSQIHKPVRDLGPGWPSDLG